MKRRTLIEAIIAFTFFCGLSLISRLSPFIFPFVVLFGIAFPLIWGAVTKDMASIGFTRKNIGKALLAGMGAGLLLFLYVWFSSEREEQPFLELQLAVGFIIWILILSPFQEFFFRGWLQPRFQKTLGIWPGLAITSVSFAIWHLCPPFEESQIVPIMSISGMVFATGMGFLFGYVFQFTKNIVAPWIAHSIVGMALVATGAMTLVQYVE